MDNKLKQTVIKFFKDNDVTCGETIHQCDRVIEHAYEFLEELFEIVKYDLDIKTPYKCPNCNKISNDDDINNVTKEYFKDRETVYGIFVCPKCNEESYGLEWELE